jgi:hypothetical protein
MNLRGNIEFIHALCDEGNCTDESCDKIKSPPRPKLPVAETCKIEIALPPGATPTLPAPATPPTAPLSPQSPK